MHGGVYAALAESLTSAATYNAVKDDDMVAMGMSNNTAFLRPITEGRIEAVGKAALAGQDHLGLGRRHRRLRGPRLRGLAGHDRGAPDSRS